MLNHSPRIVIIIIILRLLPLIVVHLFLTFGYALFQSRTQQQQQQHPQRSQQQSEVQHEGENQMVFQTTIYLLSETVASYDLYLIPVV